MNYRECLEQRLENEKLIGEIVESKGVQYKVEDLIIAPPDQIIFYLTDYHATYNYEKAVSRYITMTDLELMIFGKNVKTNQEAVVKVSDLD